MFGLRGEGLWLVCDRVANRGSAAREYTQFFALPVRIPEEGFSDRVRLLAAAGLSPVEEDPAAGRRPAPDSPQPRLAPVPEPQDPAP